MSLVVAIRTPLQNLSLRDQFANRLWQSVTPVPSAPLPKGGRHGEAVPGGFFSRPPAGHTGPALQGVSLSEPDEQGRPPLQTVP